MQVAPLPHDEAFRLARLRALDVLDTEPLAELDALVAVASQVCNTPISLISLVDADRQWFKANLGLTGVSETSRDVAFCAHAILGSDVFEVPDALTDPRFTDNPLVTGEPNIRFYAGVPLLLSDGAKLGTLCVIDRSPHELSEVQKAVLRNLAIAASAALERSSASKALAKAHLEAAQSNEIKLRLAAIIEHSEDAVISKDLHSRVVTWNRSAERMFGYTAQEMIGQGISCLFPASRVHEEMDFVEQLRRGESIKHFETQRQHKDGHTIAVSITLSPIFDPQGQVIGCSKVIRDIGERLAAEAALRASEQDYRTLVECLFEGVVLQWADGSIVSCNRSAERLLGLSYEQMMGKRSVDPSWRCVHEDMSPYPGETHPAMRVLATGEPVHEDIMGVFKPDGHITWISINSQPLMDADSQKPNAVVTTFIDITERLSQQRALQDAKEAAVQASVSKSQFLANMSHEIRTPMNAVLGMAYLLGTTPLSSDQRRYLDMVRVSGQNLLGLLNDILDFSKIEAGRLELAPSDFAMDDMLSALASSVSVHAGEKPVEFVIAVDANVPQVLFADALRLQQVLLNLCGNAVKFTSQGEVALWVSLQDGHDTGPVLCFEVRDTGIGLTESHMAQLFTPFTQADASITRRFGGTGLGLSITRQLVELMGGHLGVSSTYGAGSTFWFTVPCASPLAPHAPARFLAPRRALVVDDNASSRTALVATLVGWGWQVVSATDGASAERTWQQAAVQAPFEVVLMDWEMPGEDGIATTRRLRDGQPACQAPVVLMVDAYARARLGQVESANGTPSGILIKPFTATSLAQVLEDALAENQKPQESRTLNSNGSVSLVGLHILVVDDNQMNQAVARGILEHVGATVEVASHGQEALDVLTARPGAFALVLMDVQMPVMDGLTATRKIRKDLGLTVPVLAMTAGVMASERAQCRDAGMDDVIGKPLNVEGMLACVARHGGLAVVDSQMADALQEPGFAPDAMLHATGNHPTTRHAVVTLCQSLQRDGLAPLQQVIKCIDHGKLEEAARQLHSMRGAMGSLGARAFAASALALEHAIREGAHPNLIQVLQDAALHDYQAVIDGAARWLAAQPDTTLQGDVPTAHRPDALRVRAWLTQLHEQDMNALMEYAELQASLEATLSAQDASALSAAMSALDFEAALHILEQTEWATAKQAHL